LKIITFHQIFKIATSISHSFCIVINSRKLCANCPSSCFGFVWSRVYVCGCSC